MKTLKLFLAITAIASAKLVAQSTGMIKGNVVDEKGLSVLYAPVALMEDSTIIGGATTDDKGNFIIKDITPGRYNLRISHLGYNTMELKEVNVSPVKICYVDIKMQLAENMLDPIVISAKLTESILDAGYETITKIDIEQIENSATGKTDVIALAVMITPAVTATPDGKDIYVRGSRRGSSAYYVDGNKMIGTPEIPGLSIGSMEVLTGGMPAEYGDCTGGLVIITTNEYKWEMRKKQMNKTTREERKEKKN